MVRENAMVQENAKIAFQILLHDSISKLVQCKIAFFNKFSLKPLQVFIFMRKSCFNRYVMCLMLLFGIICILNNHISCTRLLPCMPVCTSIKLPLHHYFTKQFMEHGGLDLSCI